MATKLVKNIIRESSETIDEKEIIITLTSDQNIELKVKGKRGHGETVNIKDLYNQLYGLKSNDGDNKGSLSTKKSKKRGDNKMISLYDLRSHNAISMLDLDTVVKCDQIIKSVIDEQ